MQKLIPIAFMFDNNYVIPAGVAFYSLLENADKSHFYHFYVLHNDITLENQEKLHETVKYFQNAQLEFINMTNDFDDIWKKIKIKGHYSKEIFYKFIMPSLFPQYEKLIITDVDVVFCGDISESYFSFEPDEDFYIAGVKGIGKMMHFMDAYKKDFTEEEIQTLQIGAGYMIYNLKKMREAFIEEKLIKCLEKNSKRVRQPEQDILNLVCYPKIKYLHLKYMTCTYLYDLYKNEDDFKNDSQFSEKELKEAFYSPVQLHYATHIKPWLNPSCAKSEEWFKYLVKTPFLKDCLINMDYLTKEQSKITKHFFNFSLELSKKKKIIFEVKREKLKS